MIEYKSQGERGNRETSFEKQLSAICYAEGNKEAL